jgi:hypothetical protein
MIRYDSGPTTKLSLSLNSCELYVFKKNSLDTTPHTSLCPLLEEEDEREHDDDDQRQPRADRERGEGKKRKSGTAAQSPHILYLYFYHRTCLQTRASTTTLASCSSTRVNVTVDETY